MTGSRLSRWLLFYLAMLLADAAVVVAAVEAAVVAVVEGRLPAPQCRQVRAAVARRVDGELGRRRRRRSGDAGDADRSGARQGLRASYDRRGSA